MCRGGLLFESRYISRAKYLPPFVHLLCARGYICIASCRNIPKCFCFSKHHHTYQRTLMKCRRVFSPARVCACHLLMSETVPCSSAPLLAPHVHDACRLSQHFRACFRKEYFGRIEHARTVAFSTKYVFESFEPSIFAHTRLHSHV
jgi:hypothetical protein